VHMYAINTAHCMSIKFNKRSTFKAVRKMPFVIITILPLRKFCYEVGYTINIFCLFFNGKLEWLGYVIRMDHIRITKNIFASKPEGTWKVRRPKPRWLGKLPNNIQVSKMKRWWHVTWHTLKELSVILRYTKVQGS
jgi:hypothetical protein